VFYFHRILPGLRPALFVGLLALVLIGCQVGAGTPPSLQPADDGLHRVTFLDVGQGDAALVQTADGRAVLIDAGPPEAGDRVVAALRSVGVERLDWIVGSHPHADHIGGFLELLPRMAVDAALDPAYNHGTATQESYLRLLRDHRVRTVRARAGRSIDVGDGARLSVLAPFEPLMGGTNTDANNNSIVARLDLGQVRFLFTGDMETPQRDLLLAKAPPEDLRAHVLKVSHHGSHNGTDAPLLEAVQPHYAVISAAAGNQYGHPHQEVLDLLTAHGVPVLRTDLSGDLVFTTDGVTLELAGETGEAGGVERARPPAASKARQRAGPLERDVSAKSSLIGNRNSRVVHAPGCPSLPKVENQVMLSAEEAAKQGYRPHSACLP
jgi:competence protein ComEC